MKYAIEPQNENQACEHIQSIVELMNTHGVYVNYGPGGEDRPYLTCDACNSTVLLWDFDEYQIISNIVELEEKLLIGDHDWQVKLSHSEAESFLESKRDELGDDARYIEWMRDQLAKSNFLKRGD